MPCSIPAFGSQKIMETRHIQQGAQRNMAASGLGMNVADGIILRRRRRRHLLDMIEQDGDLPVMLRYLTRRLLVGGKHLAEFHETFA
jgi:hypothetical protein